MSLMIFQHNSYLITGGAIKLTRTMQEREHTLFELHRLELVRNFLIAEGAYDLEGFPIPAIPYSSVRKRTLHFLCLY